ncbi:MAG: trypsin-like peptidase domain-containing protein [Deltaproteobacteria bacterium]|nr:trypsin-like peptidase domain-containing protein [Deltaproteobacteria bacterium]
MLKTIILLFASLAVFACRPVKNSDENRNLSQNDDSEQTSSPIKIIYPNVPGSFVEIARKVKPSVVNIFTATLIQDGDRNNFSMFEDLFGTPHRDRIQRSLGSGFIIDTQGYILTNYHVIKGAQKILVQLSDKREVSATPVGIEPTTDVALLHIEADKLQPVYLGSSDLLEVGEWVLAIGNPFGLSQTVTAGIVSAKGRSWSDLGEAEHGYQNFIQTDASINPGNSGGPLVNVNGEVVGMNTAITAEGQGIGFAVPAEMLKVIVPQLKKSGRIVPAWLGVGIRDMDKKIASVTGAPNGVLITEIYKSGPAHKAGLRPGDIIIKFNDKNVSTSSMLAWMTTTAGIGNSVDLKIMRSGELLDVQIEVQARPIN